MRLLAEHLTELRAWCKQCLPGWWNTRRAPSRHSRDARVYGHQDYDHAQTEYTLPSPCRDLDRKCDPMNDLMAWVHKIEKKRVKNERIFSSGAGLRNPEIRKLLLPENTNSAIAAGVCSLCVRDWCCVWMCKSLCVCDFRVEVFFCVRVCL